MGLLEKLAEDDPLRFGLELQLQMTLAPALIAVKGFAAPEVKSSFSRSRALCDMIGASEPLFPAMRGLMSFYSVHADYDSAIDIGAELQAVVEQTKDSGQQLELGWVMGSALLFSGKLGKSMAFFEQARSLYDPSEHAPHAIIYGQDPGVATLTHYLVGLNLQARYDEAQEVATAVMQLTGQLNHPFTRAQAAGFLQSALFLRGDYLVYFFFIKTVR